MFDAHIQFYSYNNTKNDEFGVGYLGNKDFWVHLMNTWNRNDNLRQKRVTTEDWDELDCETDFRGCQLAEIEPDHLGSYVVRWNDGDNENSMLIDNYGKIVWENNPQNIPSVPRWVTRLKNQLREA